jgi:phosphoglycerate dehydrogenase-like enzyme
MPVRVVIATPLEPELAARVRDADPRVELAFFPELLPPPRYQGDHHGDLSFARGGADERRFRDLLASAEVVLGIPRESPHELSRLVREAPRLRFLQAMTAGAGELVRDAGLSPLELERVAVASAAGVHAGPLAEFAMLGVLAFSRGLPALLADQRARRWVEHAPVQELCGKTLLVLGLGAIGRAVAQRARAFGMRVVATRRRPGTAIDDVHEVHPPDALARLVEDADAIVVTLPLTEETRGLVDRETIARMRSSAIFVNVGRGAVVDEEALAGALAEGRLAGAALDVFEREPLPPESPLWELPNVIVSPHTAALSALENERIVALFVDNVCRYLGGRPLRNRIDPDRFY